MKFCDNEKCSNCVDVPEYMTVLRVRRDFNNFVEIHSHQFISPVDNARMRFCDGCKVMFEIGLSAMTFPTAVGEELRKCIKIIDGGKISSKSRGDRVYYNGTTCIESNQLMRVRSFLSCMEKHLERIALK